MYDRVDFAPKGGFSFSLPNPDDVPLGILTVPFIWNYFGTELKMKFAGGFTGVK